MKILPVQTDHGQLQLQFEILCQNTSTHTGPTPQHVDLSLTNRYNLKYLQQTLHCDLLRTCYEEARSIVMSLIQTPQRHTTNEADSSQLIPMVDRVGQSLQILLQVLAEEILGTYEVVEAKSYHREGEDNLEQLKRAKSQTTLAKAVERLHRQRTTIFTSPNPIQHPVDRAVDTYKDLFSTPSTAIADHSMDLLQDSTLINTFSVTRLRRIIKRYPSTKACGEDGLHCTILKTLAKSKLFLEDLRDIFNWFIQCGTTPACWNSSLLTLIPKNNEGETTIDNSRPIALTSMIRRIFEAGILDAIPNDWKRMYRGQVGFQRHVSTSTAILLADELPKWYRPFNEQLNVQIFLDFRKAYDTVPHQKLLEKVQTHCQSPRFTNIVYHLFTRQCTSKLVVNGIKSTPVKRHRGVFQGSILSPLLFNIFINDLGPLLDTHLSPSPFQQHIKFADDVLSQPILARSTSIQTMMNAATLWARQNGMTFNVSKCGIVDRDTTSLILDKALDFTLDGQHLPIVPKYKYLGINISRRGAEYEELVDRQITKAIATLRFFQARGLKALPEGQKTMLIKTFVLSQVEYLQGLIAIKFPEDRFWTDKYTPVLTECLQFIFGSKQSWGVLLKMTNMKTPSMMREYAHFRLSQQFYREHSNNLLKDTEAQLHQTNLIAWSASKFKRIALHQPFQDYIRARQTEPSLRALTFIRENLWTPSSPLVKAITAKGKMDGVLFIDDTPLRKKAIQWRRGNSQHLLTCNICRQQFSRHHPDYHATEYPIWHSNKNKRQQYRSPTQTQPIEDTNVLDCLLNSRDWEQAKLIFDEISKNTVPKQQHQRQLKRTDNTLNNDGHSTKRRRGLQNPPSTLERDQTSSPTMASTFLTATARTSCPPIQQQQQQQQQQQHITNNNNKHNNKDAPTSITTNTNQQQLSLELGCGHHPLDFR